MTAVGMARRDRQVDLGMSIRGRTTNLKDYKDGDLDSSTWS